MRWLAIWLVLGVCSGGCDRRTSSATTTAPDASATSAAPPCVLTIDGVNVQFGPAHLRVQAADAGVSVLLSSQEAAHTFSFDMALNPDDPQDLTNTQWHFQAASAERSNSPDGILLDGGQRQLQPLDVTIVFADQQTLTINGRFLFFADPDAATAQRVVTVSGRILFATDGHR